MAARRSIAALALAAAACVAAPEADAHSERPGVLALEERDAGDFRLAWTPPVLRSGDPAATQPRFPTHCAQRRDRLECDGPLEGRIAFSALPAGTPRVFLIVRWRDGTVLESQAGPSRPWVDLSAPRRASASEWVWLGAEHIVLGPDHLAFVLGLLLLLGARIDRRLIAAITAFTLAHCLTLALAITGAVSLAAAPVEALIAASIVLVAREALHDGPTLSRRMPWLIAGTFGLVHGLGFAGALTEMPMPRSVLASHLLAFNIGIELGQIAFVAAALALARAARRLPAAHRFHTAISIALGSIGIYWMIDRISAFGA